MMTSAAPLNDAAALFKWLLLIGIAVVLGPALMRVLAQHDVEWVAYVGGGQVVLAEVLTEVVRRSRVRKVRMAAALGLLVMVAILLTVAAASLISGLVRVVPVWARILGA